MPVKPTSELSPRYRERREAMLAYQRQYRSEHNDRVRAIDRKSKAKRRSQTNDRLREDRRRKPLKCQAQGTTKKAIRCGQLAPGPCENGHDCLGSVQPHHDDYAQTLTVRWLCRRHHQQWHAVHGEGLNAALPALDVGPPRPKPKLADEHVAEVRRLRAAGVPPSEIAQRFGVSRSLVYMIGSGRVRKSA